MSEERACNVGNRQPRIKLKGPAPARLAVRLKVLRELVTLPCTPWTAAMLTEEERRQVVTIARDAIVHALGGARSTDHRAVPSEAREEPHTGALAFPGGAFVTIRIARELRGCIGYIESPLPLAEVIAEVAVKAATEDPRFPPLDQSELARATLEVSVLSPLVRVRDITEIIVGTHGLLIELGRARGLLLPQVATEYGWGRETFLAHTSRKAGLPADAWKDPGAIIYSFTAEVIQEPDS